MIEAIFKNDVIHKNITKQTYLNFRHNFPEADLPKKLSIFWLVLSSDLTSVEIGDHGHHI